MTTESASSLRSGTLFVLVATFGLALKGIWARLAYAEGLDVSTVLFYRSALSAPLVAVSTWWLLHRESKRRHSPHATPAVQVRWRAWAAAALLGGWFSIGMFCDFEAIRRLGAGVSRVLLFGFPLVVMALEAAWNKTFPTGRKLLSFFVAWCGLLCVASPGFGARSQFGAADLAWGFAALVLYALYVFASGQLSQLMGSTRFTGVSNLSTSFVVVSFFLSQNSGSVPSAAPSGLVWVAVMVVVSTVFPYFLLTEGIRRLGSSQASLLAMNGPVVTLIAGYLVLGEEMNPLQLIGTGLTLLGVGFATGKLHLRKPPVSPSPPAQLGLKMHTQCAKTAP